MSARPVHRNGLQAGHSCFELLIKRFVVDTVIDLCGVEILMPKQLTQRMNISSQVANFDASLTAFPTSFSLMLGYTWLRDSMISLTYRYQKSLDSLSGRSAK